MARAWQLVAIGVVVVLIAAVVLVSYRATTEEEVPPELTEAEEWLSDLDDLLTFENQSYDFDMSELYAGWE